MDEPVQIQLFGALRVERAGVPLHGFESRKAVALLGYLVARRVAVPRSQLVDMLWPDLAEKHGRGNLRRVLHNLHTLLPGCLAIERQTVQITGAPTCTVDLWAFADLTAQGTRSALVAAADLYRGPFLEGLYLDDCPDMEAWLTQEREQWQQRAIAVLEKLLARHRAQRDWNAGLQAVAQLLALDPWREAAHRDKMQLLAASGQRDAAMAAYDACRHILAEEFGGEPEDETSALYQQIRAGVLPTATEARRYHVPTPPTTLIGRSAELADMIRLLAQPNCRLLTLTGVGGTGKTHLALAALAELLPRFADGVWFVDLAPINDSALVVAPIAQALRIAGSGTITAQELHAWLCDKQLLLCLDNFEQLLDAAPVVSRLLAASPHVQILVTSRAALNVRGEQLFPVGPLVVPDPQRLRAQRDHIAATLRASPAAALFIDRAVNALPTFVVTDATAPVVAEICVRLEGLPLAIELAAPYLKLFSLEMLLVRLDQRLAFLTVGRRDQPPRHMALRAAIDWSYQLLDRFAQVVFARLGVFVGGWTLAEAVAVAGEGDNATQDVAAALMTLVDHNLVRQRHDERGEPRFGMLETLREYALEQLTAQKALAATRCRHLATFLALAEAAAPELQGPAQPNWFARLALEHDNLRAALQWAHETEQPVEQLRLANALHVFWLYHGHHAEGRRWLELGLQHALPHGPTLIALRAHALHGAGMFASWEDNPQATALFDESVALFRTLNNRHILAQVLYELGSAYAFQAEHVHAERALKESLEIAHVLNDPFLIMHATARLGICASFQGDTERALPLLDAGLAWVRQHGDAQFTAVLTVHLGSVWLRKGELSRAEALFEETLAHVQHVRRRVLYPLIGVASVALQRGDAQRAAQVMGAVDASNIPLMPAARFWHSALLAEIHTRMGDEATRRAWTRGQQMSLEGAMAYVREGSLAALST